ncbi:MAG: hypothetical protein FWF82_01200 [Oscillospiraceae bacterium]|nr:hypothetical protein [Oscillospiraceae bacterium]
MKNNLLKQMKKVASRQGSVLFIVLVVMTFLIIIAAGVFYTVSTSRQSVVMEYSDAQASQTANDILNAIDTFIFNTDPSGNDAHKLGLAINNLDILDAMQIWHVNVIGDVGGDAPTGANWNVQDLIDKGLFVEGVHYLKTVAPTTIGGGGDASILIYVNARGDIVVEVTVEYNGRKVTEKKIYDSDTVTSIIDPMWRDLATIIGEGLGYKWAKGGDLAAPPDDSKGWDGSDWKQITDDDAHFLSGRGGKINYAKGDWVLRVDKPYYLNEGINDELNPWWLWNEYSAINPEDINSANTSAKMGNGGEGNIKSGIKWIQVESDNLADFKDIYPWVKIGDWLGYIPKTDPDAVISGRYCALCEKPWWGSDPLNWDNGRPGVALDIANLTDAMKPTSFPDNVKCNGYCMVESWLENNFTDTYCARCEEYLDFCVCVDTVGGSITCKGPGEVNGVTYGCGKPWGTGAGECTGNTCRICTGPGGEFTCLTSGGRLWSECQGRLCARCSNCGASWNWTINAPAGMCSANCGASSGTGTPTGPPLDTDGKVSVPTLVDDGQGGTVDVQGSIPFAGPNNMVWYQRAAHHSTGNGKSGTTYDNLGLRAVNATSHFDVDWAILNKTSTRGSWRSDISANHNLVLGDSLVNNPLAFNRDMYVTVGGNLYIGGSGTEGPVTGTITNGEVSNNTSKKLVFFVAGDLIVHSGNSNAYGKVGEVTYYVLGDFDCSGTGTFDLKPGVTIYYAGTTRGDLRGNNVLKLSDEQIINEVKAEIDFRTGGVPNRDWNMVAQDADRNFTVSWGSGVRGDGARISQLTTRYGIKLGTQSWTQYNEGGQWSQCLDEITSNGGTSTRSMNVEERIFYIDGNCTLTAGSSGGDQNNVNLIIIDTGLGSQAKTINITLNPGADKIFNWKGGMGQTYRVAVLTIGDGEVVFQIPNDAKYKGTEGFCVAPFNLAVRADTSQDGWLGDPRLRTLARGEVRGITSETEEKIQACLVSCGTDTVQGNYNGGSVNKNRCSWNCWLNGLLQKDGSGKIRTSFAEEEIRPRKHENPLNLKVFLVYNGTASDGLVLPRGTFHALSVYAPRMVFANPDSGDNMVMHFGSIFASELKINSQYFYIAVMPGGGIGMDEIPGIPPVANIGNNKGGTQLTGDSTSTPNPIPTDPDFPSPTFEPGHETVTMPEKPKSPDAIEAADINDDKSTLPIKDKEELQKL